MTSPTKLAIRRLRVMSNGRAVYDQLFHLGVNIIRGDNGSGKSTISDFIFYILGGEFGDWKNAAQQCDEVQAEIETKNGTITTKRKIGTKLTPVSVYFGAMHDAAKAGIDGWTEFPIRRAGGAESYSQVLFRSIGIPEAKSEGASNITMHQIMRLLYSDQKTPPPRLFRFESFDTPSIREADGDIICGISGYELYELNLEHRAVEKDYQAKASEFNSIIKALPSDFRLEDEAKVDEKIAELQTESQTLSTEIEGVESLIPTEATEEYNRARADSASQIGKAKQHLRALELALQNTNLELKEVVLFEAYLEETHSKVLHAQDTAESIGEIDFTYCPSCMTQLKDVESKLVCKVCGTDKNPAEEKNKYNQIRLDFEIQLRETRQLISDLNDRNRTLIAEFKATRADLDRSMIFFSSEFEKSLSPREAFLAQRNRRIGEIQSDINYVRRIQKFLKKARDVAAEKETLRLQLEKLQNRKNVLEIEATRRRKSALKTISKVAADLLRQDHGVQEEFVQAQEVEVNFRDDAIFVDGKMNFAESSNVYLKNAVFLAIFLAAGIDAHFYHPKFLLMDNIEDKGMQPARSHLFQALIVRLATELKIDFQIIFTTSMMNAKLELEEYVVGPYYSKENRTLQFNGPPPKNHSPPTTV